MFISWKMESNETMKFVDELISEVRKRPVIWEKNKYHHNRRSRMVVEWQAIASKFKMTPKKVKLKWYGIKRTFYSEERKMNYPQGDESKPNIAYYTGQWVHFEKLLFLCGTKGNVEEYVDPTSPEEIDEEECDSDDFAKTTLRRQNPQKKLKFVDELINEVKKRPVIWDINKYQFNRKVVMNEEWKAIATKFKKTPDEVKAKWRALRNRYHIESFRREGKKKNFTQGDEKNPHISDKTGRWEHFKKLAFLYGQTRNNVKHITPSSSRQIDADESEMRNEAIKVECDLFEHFDDFEINYIKTENIDDLEIKEIEDPIEDDQKMLPEAKKESRAIESTSADQNISYEIDHYEARGNVEHIASSSSEKIKADASEMSIKDIEVACDTFEQFDDLKTKTKTTLRRQKLQIDSKELKFVDELISEVKKRTVIWDINKYRFHRREMQAEEWQAIASKFRMTPNEVRTKWYRLKDTFRREQEKLKLPEGDHKKPHISDYTGQWVHFEKLLFLYGTGDNFNKNITTSSSENIDGDESAMTIEDIKVEYDVFEHVDDFEHNYAKTVNIDDLDSKEVEDLIEDQQNTLPEATESRAIENTSADQNIDNCNVLRKRSADETTDGGDKNISATSPPMLTVLPLPTNEPEESTLDEDVLFVRSLVPFFRRLNPIKKMLVKNEMQNLVIKEMLCNNCRSVGPQPNCRCNLN